MLSNEQVELKKRIMERIDQSLEITGELMIKYDIISIDNQIAIFNIVHKEFHAPMSGSLISRTTGEEV